MYGVRVMRQLLVGDVGVTNLVPAAKIQADILPQGTNLDAILIEEISSVPLNTLKRGTTKHFRDRIQVTPMSADYERLTAMVRAIEAACADTFPEVEDLQLVSVLLDSLGPFGIHPVNMARTRSMDFIVSLNV